MNRFCKHCGSKLNEDSKFCPSCGQAVPSGAQEAAPVASDTQVSNAAADASKVVNGYFHVGRLGRAAFATSMLVSIIILILLMVLQVPMGLVMTFVFINFAWMILIYVGRLHDVGVSGWWTLLVMFTSGLGMIALAVWPGEKRSNKYGPVVSGSVKEVLHFWRT